MKKLWILLLVLTLLLTACVRTENVDHRLPEDLETRIPEAETFELLNDKGSYPLYYYNYTQDYHFDEFLASGGAADTAELVEFIGETFPEMELDLSRVGYGCSSFCAESENGDVIFGRNFDMFSSHTGAYLVVHTAPEDGYASYSTVNLGFLGLKEVDDPIGDETSPLQMAPYLPLDGINSKGVAICVLQLNFKAIQADGGFDVDMTPTTIIRNVLDHAADLDEALEIFETCNLYTEGYAYHFMIADADGNAAVVEYVDHEMIVLEKDGDILTCANAFITEAGRDFYRIPDGNESDRRVQAIEAAIAEQDFDLSAENTLTALAAAHQTGTRWSIAYNLTEKSMTIAINRDLDVLHEFFL